MSAGIHGHQKVHRSLEFRDRINNLRENFSHYDDSPIATLERPILIFSLFLLLLGCFQDVVHDSMIIAFTAMEIAECILVLRCSDFVSLRTKASSYIHELI